MSSRRALKAAQAIREVVSTAILLELKDPRVKDVTVTLVEVAGDLRAAKVYVSIMGDETKQELCLNGLRNSTGFLQKKIGNRIDTRYTPRIKFVLDKGAHNALEVTRILNEVLPAEASTEAASATADDEFDNQDADTPVAETANPGESVWDQAASRRVANNNTQNAQSAQDSHSTDPVENPVETGAPDHSSPDLAE